MENNNQETNLNFYVDALNKWSNENFTNEKLKEKVFLSKVLCHLFISSESKDTYGEILSILFPNSVITEKDILLFLESFRGETLDDKYFVFFKINDIEENLIFTLDISKLIGNENQTIN